MYYKLYLLLFLIIFINLHLNVRCIIIITYAQKATITLFSIYKMYTV